MAQAQAPVVPVQTCKLNPPRDVRDDESRESLTNWLDTCTTFFSSDDNYKRFVLPGATWNPNAPNYGFVAEGQNTKLRRTAPEVEAALRRFFSSVSMFFPYNFLTRRFVRSTSWEDMKQIVYRAFNMQLNAASLLRSNETLKWVKGENPYIFYERVLDHFIQHLAGPNIAVEGHDTGAAGDAMNLSFNNFICFYWLERIDRRLPKVVLVEYGAQLRGNTQLVELVPRISDDMDALLTKLEEGRINRLRGSGAPVAGRDNRQFPRGGFQGNRGNSVRRNGRDNRGGRGRGASNPQQHCSHCKHLGNELNMFVPADHNPLDCQRRRVHVRRVEEESQYEDVEEEEADDFWEDADDDEEDGELTAPYVPLSNSVSLQVMSERPEARTRQCEEDPGGGNLNDCILSCPTISPPSQSLSSGLLSDLEHQNLSRLTGLLRRFSDNSPTKAHSPSLVAEYRGKMVHCIVDSGAELNCVDLRLAQEMSIPFEKTDSAVKVPGNGEVVLAGVTTEDQ